MVTWAAPFTQIGADPEGIALSILGIMEISLIGGGTIATYFPTLFQDALDTLSLPVMQVECERAFSGSERMITPHRNRL